MIWMKLTTIQGGASDHDSCKFAAGVDFAIN
jgi:hypothetical protein